MNNQEVWPAGFGLFGYTLFERTHKLANLGRANRTGTTRLHRSSKQFLAPQLKCSQADRKGESVLDTSKDASAPTVASRPHY